MDDNGDLNELTSSFDKLASQKENSSRYNKFMKILNGNNLVDIGCLDCHILGQIIEHI